MRSIRLLLAPLALASLAASCGGQDSLSVPSSAIAVVGDRTISRSQFTALMAQARQSYAAQGRPFPATGSAAYTELKRLAVSLLVEQAELDQKAPGLGVRIDYAQVEAGIRRLKEESFGGSEQRYRTRLRAAGMTDAQVRSAVRAQLLAEAVRLEVTADVTVKIQAVQQYYERHLGDYTTPRNRVIRHILVRTRAAAERAASRFAAGASFATIAERSSVDSSTREQGGRLRLVEGRTAPDLDRVAFSLGVGRISRPFRTSFGWELVQAVSPTRPRQTRPFAAVRDGIRRHLLTERRARVFKQWLERMRSEFESRTAFAKGFAPTGGS
jgi:parvulin-like peptidyl-prolyl isomerase